MKLLRGFILVALVAVVSCAIAGAQSLADVAKKEKSRRQENATSTKVITERELAQSYGGLRESTQSASGDQSGADEDEGEDDASLEQDETKTREYWQRRVTGVNRRASGAERMRCSRPTPRRQQSK